jgi:Holliday junction resolvase RusA-like endonuclease
VPWYLLCSDNRKYVKGYILSKQYRSAKEGLGLHSALCAQEAGWQATDAPLSIRWVVTEPDKRRRDLSFSKQTKDGITLGGGIWKDDDQVRDEHWVFTDTPNKNEAGAWCSIAKLGGLPEFVW